LKIELGTKEGIFTNQRFLVYQQVQKSDGRVVSKPVAAVRVRKIADNERRVSDESRVELSKCYQYQGRKIEDGMFMRQFNEIGLEVGYEGLYNKGLAQYYHALKFSYDVSRYLGGAQIRVFAKTVSGINEGNLKNLVYSGLVDVSEGSNNGLFFITDSLQYQRETQTLSNTPVTYALSTRIPFIGEVGFSYEYNYLKNFFLRGELGAMGYYIGLPNGSNLVVGNSSSYSTLSELKLNGLLGRLNVGYFLSPSISVYGGVGLSILRVKATGNFETAVKGNNLINQNISFGLKFNL
jgi:opacity protein-like surface antigen